MKGFAEKTNGAVKQGAGKVSGDKEMEHEGTADKAKGDMHKAAGNVKDAARKAGGTDCSSSRSSVAMGVRSASLSGIAS